MRFLIATVCAFLLLIAPLAAQLDPLPEEEQASGTNETVPLAEPSAPEPTMVQEEPIAEPIAEPTPDPTPPQASSAPQPRSPKARAASLSLAASKHLIAMDAAIATAQDKSLNYSALTPIRESFAQELGGLAALNEPASVRAKEDLMQDLAKQFRVKAKEIGLRAYGSALEAKQGQLLTVRSRELDDATENAIESRKEAMLMFFDHHVELAQEAINKSEARNVSMDSTKEALAQFIALKPELVLALNSNSKDDVSAINKELKSRWANLRNTFTQAHDGQRLKLALGQGNEIASRARDAVRGLEKSKKSSGALEARLNDFTSALAAAQTALDEGRYSDAHDSLAQAKLKLGELKTTYAQAAGAA